jgi:hypothetical protein
MHRALIESGLLQPVDRTRHLRAQLAPYDTSKAEQP